MTPTQLLVPRLILFLPPHNPLTMILSILLLPLLALHLLLHLKLLRYIQPPLHSRSLINRIHPLLDRFELTDVHACPFGPVHPAEARKVCDSAFIAYEPGTFGAWLGGGGGSGLACFGAGCGAVVGALLD